MAVSINCDLGEAFGIWRLGDDEGCMPFITHANIACGYHASDPRTMWRTVRLAKQHVCSRRRRHPRIRLQAKVLAGAQTEASAPGRNSRSRAIEVGVPRMPFRYAPEEHYRSRL